MMPNWLFSMRANRTGPLALRARKFSSFGWPAILLLLTLPVAWPLAADWLFTSHDGILHLFRLQGLDTAIRQGVLYPRIFPEFAFAYGHAVLSYYGPLVYYIAELPYLLGASLTNAFKFAILLGFWGSALSAYAMGRRFAGPVPALFGSLAFVYFPYHIADAYYRGALAEHWAWVFLPLILLAVTPISTLEQEPKLPQIKALFSRHTLLFVAAVAALIVTHALTALMFMPFVMLYAWVVSPVLPYTRRVLSLALPSLAALALSSFYWLPVVFQSRWVQLSAISSATSYGGYFASLNNVLQLSLLYDYVPRAGMPDEPLGLIWFLLLLASIATGLLSWRRRQPVSIPFLSFIALGVISLYLTIDISLPFWQAASGVFAYLQFPWRFMTLAGLGLAMASVFVFKQHPKVAAVCIPLLIVTSMVSLPVAPAATTASDPLSMWLMEARTSHIGSTWNDEYLPWWVSSDPRRILRAALSPTESNRPPDRVQLHLVSSSYTSEQFIVSSEMPWVLRTHQFYLPQWRVSLDGKPLATYPSTDLGLLSADLPPSSNSVLEVEYGSTFVEQLGIALSVVSGVALLLLTRSYKLVTVALAALLVGVGWVSFHSQSAQDMQFVQATAGDFAELVAVRGAAGSYRPGDRLQFTTTWLALRDTGENFNTFVHLSGAQTGQVLAQSDGIPVGGFSPTSRWHAGEIIEDPRTLTIPANATPGTYSIDIGMYRLQPVLENLPISQNGQSGNSGQITVGTVQVKP